MIRFSNKSVFEQPSRTNRVQKPRFDCIILLPSFEWSVKILVEFYIALCQFLFENNLQKTILCMVENSFLKARINQLSDDVICPSVLKDYFLSF